MSTTISKPKPKQKKTLRIAIVGADERKWTKEQEIQAKQWIEHILHDKLTKFNYNKSKIIVVSGHCHLGGIDIWAEEIAKELGIKTEIYPAEVHRWKDEWVIPQEAKYFGSNSRVLAKGFCSRNIQIAEACDILYDIEPARRCKYCGGFGSIFIYGNRRPMACPKCKGDGAYSGGTWTYKKAKGLGKEVHKVIIK